MALLRSSVWPAALSMVLIAVQVAVFAGQGESLGPADALKLARMPLVIVGLSALGTMLGRVPSTPAVAPFAATLGLFTSFPADGERRLDWLAPLASRGWTSIPSLAWHAVCLAGGVVAVATVALLTAGARRWSSVLLAIGVVALVVAGAMQLPLGCRDVDLVGRVCTF